MKNERGRSFYNGGGRVACIAGLDGTLGRVTSRCMGLINAFFGTASQIDPNELQAEFEPLLVQEEKIIDAFRNVRDLFVFTQWRLILADKQGLTGKKVTYHSIPYRHITQFSVETAGHFDMDAELNIWVSGMAQPIKKDFKRGTDVRALQKLLAHCVLAR